MQLMQKSSLFERVLPKQADKSRISARIGETEGRAGRLCRPVLKCPSDFGRVFQDG